MPEEHAPRRQALAGLRIIELPSLDPIAYFAAAFGAKLFADLGATVIKVEPPEGALERGRGPFKDGIVNRESGGLHLYLNTSKLGVTIDFDAADAGERLGNLLAAADIVLNPNRASVCDRLGIGYQSLVARFPRLIVVSMGWFGIDSPYRDLRGADLIAAAMSAVAYGTPFNQVTDPPNQPPLKPAGRQADYLTGYTAVDAALSAVFDRERTGRGQHVDANQLLAMVNMVRPEIGVHSHEAPDAPYYRRLTTRGKLAMPYVAPCRDGWISFTGWPERFWPRAKKVMGYPAWAEEERFSTMGARLVNAAALETAQGAWLAKHDKSEIFELAQREKIPCFPINSPAEVVNNEQYRARRFFVTCQSPEGGAVTMPGAPFILSATPWRIGRPAPRLGEHNREIFEERAAATSDSYASERRAPSPGRRLPFEGLRVADFGWIFALPLATTWLGVLGADVIRIESARSPDLVRLLSGTDGVVGINRSGMFNAINYSKRSIALDLTNPKAGEIARRLVAMSDIVTENFGAGTMARFGLGYESLARLRPGLVMVSGTSLGQTGPLANTIGYGPNNQAFAGMCHLTGYPGGTPSGLGGTWPDFAVGMVLVAAIQAALYYQRRSGEGQYIDLSMGEVVTSMLPEAMLEYLMNGADSGPIGNRDPHMAPHGVFPVKGADEWIAIAIATDAEFEALCAVLGAPRMAADPRYHTTAGRLRNVAALEGEIAALTRAREREELVAALRDRDLAAGPVYNTEALLHDSAIAGSGMLMKVAHPVGGERIVPGLPVRFAAIAPEYRPAPLLGEHTDEVLGGLLGYNPDEIAALRTEGVIG